MFQVIPTLKTFSILQGKRLPESTTGRITCNRQASLEWASRKVCAVVIIKRNFNVPYCFEQLISRFLEVIQLTMP